MKVPKGLHSAEFLLVQAGAAGAGCERPEGMDETTVIMSGLEKARVIDAVEVATKHNSQEIRAIKPVKDYEVDNVSKKILRIILSYVDYVNRTVWHKEI